MPLYREDFERAACDCPACRETSRTSEMYFHPRCHPDSATWVRYRGDVLTVECARCRQEVVTVVIASREHEAPRPGPEDEAGVEPATHLDRHGYDQEEVDRQLREDEDAYDAFEDEERCP